MARDKLFQLIQSLTTQEKKFFRQYAHRHVLESDPVYLKLFDAMESREEYNEPEIMGLFRGQAITRNFPSAKAHLYQLIIKSLNIQHQDQSPHGKILELLSTVEVLCGKQLFHEAMQYLYMARELAENLVEVKELTLVTYRWEDIIRFSAQIFRDTTVNMEDRFAVRKDLAHQLLRITEMRHLYFEFENIMRLGALTEENQIQLKSVLSHPLFHPEPKDSTAWENRIQYVLNYVWYAHHGNVEKALEWSRRIYSLLETYPKNFYHSEYLLTYCGFMTVQGAVQAGNTEMALEYLGKMKQWKPEVAQNEYFHFHAVFYCEMIVLSGMNETDKCLERIGEYELQLPVMHKGIHRINEYRNYQFIINFLFRLDKFEWALRFINRLINDKHAEQDAAPFYVHARIMNVAAHYELHDVEILESVIRQTVYFLQSRNIRLEYVREMMAFFRKLLNPKNSFPEISKSLARRLVLLQENPLERLYIQPLFESGWIGNGTEQPGTKIPLKGT